MITDWKKAARYGALAGAVIVLSAVSLHFTKAPRADRNWSAGFEKSASFEETAPGAYRLSNLRAFTHRNGAPPVASWTAVDLRPEDISEVWFFVEPFAASDLFAHTFVSFVFQPEDGPRRTVSVSVEARTEKGEPYSALRGVLRGFELSYVWSTEKDVVTRIAVGLQHPVYAYRIERDPEVAAVVFERFMRRTNALAEKPRFYNTIGSNCTNELFKAVNDAYPGSVKLSAPWLFTGRAARRLYEDDHIGRDAASFDDLREEARIDDFARENASLEPEAFSRGWRAELAGN